MIEALMTFIGVLILVVLGFNTNKMGNIDTKVDSIDTNISEMNGSIRELKLWSTMHQKRDDEMFEEIKEALKK